MPPGGERMTGEPWRIATRRSDLARAQARIVADALEATGDRPAELVPLSTTGDDHHERAIQAFDTKGLFVDGTREAVRSGDCDMVVHSYKDLPTEPVEGLVVGAVPPRADPRDALVTADGSTLAGLPRGGERVTVGTSSPRRRAQIQRARRDVLVQPVRGNLDTRLGKVADGRLTGVAVAVAGLQRLGPVELDLRAVPLEPGQCLPAPAQGAIAVECRPDDEDALAALAAIDDDETHRCVTAERTMLAELEGGCTAPIGALASDVEGPGGEPRLELLGMVSDDNGTDLTRASHRAARGEPELLGRQLAATLWEHGGDALQRSRERD